MPLGKPVNLNELHLLTGKDRRTLNRRLANVAKKEEGRQYLYDSVQALNAIYLNESTGGDISYDAERARLTKAQADREELKVKELNGELIPAPLVADTLATVCTSIKTKLLAMPTKLAHQVVTVTELTQAQATLEQAVREALLELYTESIVSLTGPEFAESAEELQTRH